MKYLQKFTKLGANLFFLCLDINIDISCKCVSKRIVMSMKINSVNTNGYQYQNVPLAERSANNHDISHIDKNASISFKGASDSTKKMWLMFRKLSDYMKQPSEMTNALIAMIGTGAIAPFAIMCSPKKKDVCEQDEKKEREKKFFQALRQPVSAFLAFAFQVPTTIGIAMGLNHLAYKKHLKLFDDEILGHLIPDNKYLRKQAKNAMNANAKSELKEEWKEELKIAEREDFITSELKKEIKRKCDEVKLNISDEELEKLASSKKRRTDFIADKMADSMYSKLLDKKVQELSDKNFEIKDLDLVTEGYQNTAKKRFKEDFANLKKEANLNWFDKFISTMGFSNKKLSTLSQKEKSMAQEKGLELIKQDIQEGKIPDILNDKSARLRNFLENRIVKAKKLYANKIFWLTLGTNLIMVAISCVALNWLHPKFADLVDRIKDKHNAHKSTDKKKVEVRA